MAKLDLSRPVLGILWVTAGVLMVAAFHYVRICVVLCMEYNNQRRRNLHPPSFPTTRVQNIRSQSQSQGDPPPSSSNGSFSTVRLLIATNYSKECKEETCSVCLNEFNEGNEVRVLPGCNHVFHVMCIDKWLLSHSNCPLCRADTLCSSSENAATPPNSGVVEDRRPVEGVTGES